jgi:hypothetical protein
VRDEQTGQPATHTTGWRATNPGSPARDRAPFDDLLGTRAARAALASSMTRMTQRLCILVLCFAWLAAGGSGARAQDAAEVSCDGPLQGDELRFPNANVWKRTVWDVAAVPASVVGWDKGDWLRTAAFVAPTVALMVPPHPSLDVRFQRLVDSNRNKALDHFFVQIKSIPESVALAAYGAIIFSTAYFRKDKRLFEYGTLALEALAIEQFFHLTTKFMIGRESPYQGNHQGEVHGPTQLFFPGGTPSGHTATAYAMFAVLAEYWDKWPLHVLAQVGGLYVATSVIYSNQHYLSDALIGAAMGYYIGRWVVRHRSSRYRCRRKSDLAWYQKVMWLPIVSQFQSFGLAAHYRY